MMKELLLCTLFFLAVVSSGLEAATPDATLKNIRWYGQACISIQAGDLTIFADPLNLKKKMKADIILITHDHFDHFSAADLDKLKTPGQTIIAPFDTGRGNTVLHPGKSITIKNIKIETVPAYNITKTKFHPKSKNYVGYIVTVNGTRIYISGDTEKIPEMNNIHCDIAFLPLGQTYTMNSVQDAVDSAVAVKAKIAIPFHFGQYEGTQKDAEQFVSELNKKGIKSLIMKKE